MGKCRPGLNIEDSPNWDNSIYVEGDLPPNTIAFDDMDLGCGPPRSVDAPTPSLEGYWDRDDVDGTLYPKQLSDAVMVGKTAPSYDEVFGVVGKIYSSAGYMMGPGTQLIYASDSTTMGIYVEDRHSLYIEGGHIRGAQENAPMINTEDVTTSESTPPYTFYTDQDTGMYRPAANTLGFTVGGMIALILTSIGYLNIPVVPATAASASVPVLARNASTGLVEQRVLTELHTHSNKEVLDLLTAPAGSLMYNGTLVFDPSPYYTATEVDDLDAILQADIDTRSLNTHNHNLADLAERNYTSLLGLPDLSDLHSHDNKATLDRMPDYTTATQDDVMVRDGGGIAWKPLSAVTSGHWLRDTTGDPFLYPTVAGDNVKIDATIFVDALSEYEADAGVIIEGNKLKDGGITLGAGATVNEIETTLTNDATHMPTSAAVYAAIGALPTYSFSNGLTETAGAVKLGGPLTGTTDLTNAVAGTYALNIGTSSNYIGAFTVNAEGISLIGRNNSNISFYTGTGLINLQGDTVITSTKVIGTQTSVDNTYSLAAYDTDGTAYTNFITFTAGTTPTMTFPQSGGGTTNFLNADGGWSAPAGTIPVDNILDWNGTAYAPYSAQTTGAFDSSATNPISAVNRLNFDGEFYAYNIYAANATDYITITSGGQVIIHTGGADQMIFQPYVSDGAGAYGYSFDTENTLSTEGSKVATFKNNGTEVFTIYGGGQLLISERTVTGLPTPTATHGFIYMDAADDKLYFVNSATTYDLTSTGGSATFIGLTDTPADWTGGVGGYMVMVNSTPDAVEFINPGAYPINNFSGTLDGSMTILGSNTNYFDIKHAHATTGSIHLDTSTAADIGIIAYTGTDWTGNYAALYVGQQYANLVVEFSPNVKQLLINATAMLVTDSEDGIGLQYVADYSTAGKTLGARWIPDWNAVITQLGGQNVHTTITGPTVTEDGMVVYWDNTNSRYDLKTAGGAAHALLSATHTDTAAVAVARGAIIYGDATPQWNRLTISATVTHLLRTDGTDVSWGAFNFADLGTSTHASTHENEGADEISVTGLSGLLADGQTPLSHTHGNITNAGAIGSTINLPIITTTSGVLTVGSFGTGAYTFCVGNDSRLSDARTPTAHASSHLSSGGDAISLFATASTVSGLVPGSNSVGATYYLNATGNWTVPAGGGGDVFADSYTTTDLAIWGSTAKHLTDTAGKLTWNGSVLTIDDSLTATYVGIGQAASSSYGLYSIHAGTPGWFTRNKGTAVEGTAYAAMALELKTTNQVNTGGYFYFKLTTSGGGPYNMAAFGAMRDGADTTAKLEFYSYYTATRQLRMTVGADDANSSYLAVSAVNNSGDAEVRFLQATYQRGVIGWDDSADGGTGGINIETGTLTATPAIFVGNENHVCIGGQTDHSTYELYVAGDIYATGDITGNSDIRYKDVLGIVPFTWEDYMALTPIRYRSKLKENSNPTFGFSAQEMMQHWKEPVTYDYDTERYGMKYNAIIPINTTAIQKLKAEKDELEKRVAYLENEIHNLKYA